MRVSAGHIKPIRIPVVQGRREGRMRVVKRLAIAWFLLAVVPFPLRAAEKEAPIPERAPQAGSEADYVIGPGDLLNIEVWKDPTLTRPVTVLPDGKVAYPMVGEVVAAGKTVAQLQKEIEGKLSLYVKDAVLTVEVRQVTSLQIYVLGRVRTPGRIILTSNIDVLQAMAVAGGPDQFAKLSRIRIFRREGGKTVIIPFDYDDVIAGKNLESNILLRQGDVVVVP
jgi:polysaccharide biosynthesis/export protein